MELLSLGNIMAKKKKNKRKNNTKKQNFHYKNQDPSKTSNSKYKEKSQQTNNTPDNIYFGLKSKTWSIIILLFIVAIFVIFLIAPFVAGFIIAVKNNNVEAFLSEINEFTVFLGFVGTIASVLSIIVTFMDKQRYSEEKKQNDNMFSEVKNLSSILRSVKSNIETILDENRSIILDITKIKDTITMSKEVKEDNRGEWHPPTGNGEINDDEDTE